jgi:hypothetical protein
VKKTSQGENSKVGGKYGDSKIFKPTKGMERQIQNFFLINFDIWNVEIKVRMWKFWLFYERTPN